MLYKIVTGAKKIFGSEPSESPVIQGPPNQEQFLHVQPSRNTVSRSTVSVLVLGRSGSGKTSFVNACLGPEQTANRASSGRTTRTISYPATVLNQKFKLIDTPGFDTTATSNAECFVQLANHLLDRNRVKSGVTGVVYIHRAGDPLESRALAQNIKVLSEILLGENGLSRLTVLVVPANSGPVDSASTADMITHSNSALRPLFPTKDHRIMVSNFDQTDINNILMPYTSKEPLLLRIQQNSLETPQTNILALIEGCLGYCENESVRAQLDWQAKQYRAHYEKKIAIDQTSLEEAQTAVSQYSSALKQTEQQVKSHRDEISGLRRQLQQTQAEYASLRSQLQLQENTEQSDIVQGLKDLNREIDDIGRSISEYLVDSYGQISFDKDPVNVTTLDACNLDELKRLLGHAEGSSSLISSSSGVGMIAEDFFDYSIRSMLCLCLCQQVFDPFHPGVDSSQSNVVKVMYADVQQREPQAVAAKWRVESFKSIYKPDNPNITSQHIYRIAQEFLQSRLGPLISNFFGPETEVVIDPRYFDRLQRLVQMAWDWNAKLKGEVVMLGDFHLKAYPPSSEFDSTLMNEFEPDSPQPPVTSILGTLGLGLVSSRAIGGMRPPEITIVYKALVATQSLYA